MPTETVKSRQRKLVQQDQDIGSLKPTKNKKHKATQKNRLQYYFMILIFVVTALVIILAIYTDSVPPIIDRFAVRLGYKEKIYAVIFDAGTTGSRVLAYEFHKGYLDGRLVLDSEIFKEIKPGLSSYADIPKKAADQIETLLKVAKEFVPRKLWKKTPINLKATAGLRLLEPVKADNLLNTVRAVFGNSGFATRDDSVEIMNGIDEGIFSWFTVNLLLESFSGSNTVAALDLGGGSTQVTFTPKNMKQSPNLKDFIHKVSVLNVGEINVFTNSYLGLGLQAVRHAVFSHGYTSNQTELESECVNPIVHKKLWKYANVEYEVSGKDNVKSTKENPIVDLEACLKSIRNKILPLVNPKPITLRQHKISAFSYYYDRATETGLIDPFLGGEIRVGDFFLKAKEICPIPNTDQPFMCLDILYISVLLEEGYGLLPQTQLKLHKQINGHEISWALGCAYNLLVQQLKEESN